MPVLCKTLARITDAAAICHQVRAHKHIAIITNGTTAIAGHPDKSLAVYEDMVHIIMRQSYSQVEARHIIALDKQV